MRILQAVTNRLSSQPVRIGSDIPAQSTRRRKPSRDTQELSGVIGRGRYHVEGPIGTGACGIIYSAWQPELGRRVAIKVLRAQYARDAQMIHRLQHEANMAAAVRNEHVVQILDCGQLEGERAYVVMEHIEGSRLSDFMDQNGALDLPLAINIALQLATALAATHRAGIFHGDVKPDNILLCNRNGNSTFVKLIDFGVAGDIETSDTPQRHSTVCGTPSYMSPEQASGETLDGRTDLYSLGVVLYEMLSGTTPIRGSHPRELLNRQRLLPPIPLRSNPRSAHVPPRVEAIVHRCLEKDPARRYPSANDLIRELQFVETRMNTALRAQSVPAPPSNLRPSVAGLPRLTQLAAVVPANDLGRPLKSFPPDGSAPIKKPTRAPAKTPTAPPMSRIRDRSPSWATSTRASRIPKRQRRTWLRRVAPVLLLGMALGYVSASAITQFSRDAVTAR
jgi:serine/threonine protein kinase